jgi:hypothetical protein
MVPPLFSNRDEQALRDRFARLHTVTVTESSACSTCTPNGRVQSPSPVTYAILSVSILPAAVLVCRACHGGTGGSDARPRRHRTDLREST